MRAAMSCVLALLAATASVHATCAPANYQPDGTPAKPKASSFAPHPASRNHAYGAPIQPRILKSRPKKKPQLASSALPDS